MSEALRTAVAQIGTPLDSFGVPSKPILPPEQQARIAFLVALREDWKNGAKPLEEIFNAHYPNSGERVFSRDSELKSWEATAADAVKSEWDRFEASCENDPTHVPRAIFFAGGPGVGKTTESLRVARALRDEGEPVLILNANAYKKYDPFYQPLLDHDSPDAGPAVSSFDNVVRNALWAKAVANPMGTVILDSTLDKAQIAPQKIREFIGAGYLTEVRALMLSNPIEAHARSVARTVTQGDYNPEGTGKGRWEPVNDSRRPDGSYQDGLLSRAQRVAEQYVTSWAAIAGLDRYLYNADNRPPVRVDEHSREGGELLALNASINPQAPSAAEVIDEKKLAAWREKLGVAPSAELESLARHAAKMERGGVDAGPVKAPVAAAEKV